MIHWLKTEQWAFEDVWDGNKPYEVRKDDRKYKRNDVLILAELLPKDVVQITNTTPRAVIARVDSVMNDTFDGLSPGYVGLGLTILGRINENDIALYTYSKRVIVSEQWSATVAAEQS